MCIRDSANVETRGEAVFAARNAIDGIYENDAHGIWPYQSWGINRDPNAALTLDSVSYTHLLQIGEGRGVVLKKYGHRRIVRGNITSRGGFSYGHAALQSPVSYTHLDVYKRQELCRE